MYTKEGKHNLRRFAKMSLLLCLCFVSGMCINPKQVRAETTSVSGNLTPEDDKGWTENHLIDGKSYTKDTIRIKGDITISGSTDENGESNARIVNKIKRDDDGNYKPIFEVESGCTLTLENIKIDGKNKRSDTSPCIVLEDGANLVIKNGTEIYGASMAKSSDTSGNAIYVKEKELPDTSDTTDMDVLMEQAEQIASVYSTIMMEGGKIYNCEGAGIFANGAQVNIVDGEIYKCTSGVSGAGHASVSMLGGSIHDCSFAGMTINSSSASFHGGEIYNNPRGINCKDGAVNMSGDGTIRDGEFGVYAVSSDVNVESVIIKNNSTSGIDACMNSEVTMAGGVLTDNKTNGVDLRVKSTLHFTGGYISGSGIGVAVSEHSSLYWTGGTITESDSEDGKASISVWYDGDNCVIGAQADGGPTTSPYIYIDSDDESSEDESDSDKEFDDKKEDSAYADDYSFPRYVETDADRAFTIATSNNDDKKVLVTATSPEMATSICEKLNYLAPNGACTAVADGCDVIIRNQEPVIDMSSADIVDTTPSGVKAASIMSLKKSGSRNAVALTASGSSEDETESEEPDPVPITCTVRYVKHDPNTGRWVPVNRTIGGNTANSHLSNGYTTTKTPSTYGGSVTFSPKHISVEGYHLAGVYGSSGSAHPSGSSSSGSTGGSSGSGSGGGSVDVTKTVYEATDSNHGGSPAYNTMLPMTNLFQLSVMPDNAGQGEDYSRASITDATAHFIWQYKDINSNIKSCYQGNQYDPKSCWYVCGNKIGADKIDSYVWQMIQWTGNSPAGAISYFSAYPGSGLNAGQQLLGHQWTATARDAELLNGCGEYHHDINLAMNASGRGVKSWTFNKTKVTLLPLETWYRDSAYRGGTDAGYNWKVLKTVDDPDVSYYELVVDDTPTNVVVTKAAEMQTHEGGPYDDIVKALYHDQTGLGPFGNMQQGVPLYYGDALYRGKMANGVGVDVKMATEDEKQDVPGGSDGGWDSHGSWSEYTETTNHDITITVYFEPDEYTVTANHQKHILYDNSWEPLNQRQHGVVTDVKANQLKAKTTEKRYYDEIMTPTSQDVNGWGWKYDEKQTKPTSGRYVTYNNKWTVTGNSEFTLRYEPKTYTVTLDKNKPYKRDYDGTFQNGASDRGFTNTGTPVRDANGRDIHDADSMFTKSGATRSGFNTGQKLTDSVPSGTPSTMTVTFTDYCPNFGSPRMDGYTFDGWYTKTNLNSANNDYASVISGKKPHDLINGQTTVYTGNAKFDTSVVYNLISNSTIYAHWKPITYTLYFNDNSPYHQTQNKYDSPTVLNYNAMQSVTLTYDQPFALPANKYVRTTLNHMEYNGGDNVTKTSSFLGWGERNDGINYNTPNIFDIVVKNQGNGSSMKTGYKVNNEKVVSPDQGSVVNLTTTNHGSYTFYAIWDDNPDFIFEEFPDRYFTLDDAKAGMITEAELLSQVVAYDRESHPLLTKTSEQVAVAGGSKVGITIVDYSAEDFTLLEDSTSTTVTYRLEDDYGHVGYMTCVVRVSYNDIERHMHGTDYVRNITDYYSTQPEESGGFSNNSLWRTEDDYKNTLNNTFQSGNEVYSHTFSSEDFSNIRDYIDENGFGNSENPDALKNLYNQYQ